MAFSAAYIKNLKPRADRYEVWEGNGFGMRVSPKGTKSWIAVYHFEGRPRRLTLGRFPQMSLSKAREAFGKAMGDVERGVDPGTDTVEQRRRARRSETVADLVDLYLERWAKQHKRSWREDERILRKNVVPRWGRRKATSIKRRDVIELLDDLTGRGMGAGANRIFAVVRKMFRFAVERDMMEQSPCAYLRGPSPEQSRDRYLTAAELRAFWNGLEQASMAPETRLIFQFQLLTACRVGEAVGLAWDEVDLEAAWWTLPTERSKNKRVHRVPLSPAACALLGRAKALNPDSSWVYPSRMTGKPMRISAMSKAVNTNRQLWESIGIAEHFVPRDLRRTAATHMRKIGVPFDDVKKVLNHVDRSVTAVYDRHSYDAEKRQALDAWADRLEQILAEEPGKVVGIDGA